MNSWEQAASRSSQSQASEEAKADPEAEQRELTERRRGVAMRGRWVARKASGQAAAGVNIPEGGGGPLGGKTRKSMEKHLGADLSGVRVHTGGESAEAARGLGARAFTVGSDVHFAAGEFAPGSREGDRLLAHELTHVVQGQKSGVQRKAEAGAEGDEKAAEDDVSKPGEPAEQEADAMGDHVADKLHGGGDKKDDKKKDKDKKKKGGKGGKDAKAEGKGEEAGADDKGGDDKEHDEKAEHADGKEGGGAGKEAAPAIAAKLEGVGRKVFLAKDDKAPGKDDKKDAKKKSPEDLKKEQARKAAVQELSGIPIAKLGAGSPDPTAHQGADGGGQQKPPDPAAKPPGLERDTYYLQPADADKMLVLLGTFEEVQVRQFKKGFIVRRGGDEWYFERRDPAADAAQKEAKPGDGKPGDAKPGDAKGGAQGGGQHGAQPAGPQAGGAAHGGSDLGLPAPNASTIEVHGFRGVRKMGDKYLEKPKDKDIPQSQLLEPAEVARIKKITAAEPLLWAGHIGVSVDGGKNIIGFTPEKPPGMDDSEFMSQLRANQDFPGLAQNDTRVFQLASNYAATEKWNTEVLVAAQLVDSPKKTEVVKKIEEMTGGGGKGKDDGHGKKYQFPTPEANAEGSHFKDKDAANCATFPAMVGVQIPEPSGQLSAYIPKLKEWAETGPQDMRSKG